jgi:hypothetical protein
VVVRLVEGGGGGNSGGNSVGIGLAPAGPSYLDTYDELRGKTGGFDPGRLR